MMVTMTMLRMTALELVEILRILDAGLEAGQGSDLPFEVIKPARFEFGEIRRRSVPHRPRHGRRWCLRAGRRRRLCARGSCSTLG